MIEKNYKITEVMEILQVTRRTVYNYRKKGYLKGFKAGRDWRFPETEIKNFIATGGTLKEIDPEGK
jgi:excisionase family DNA binding protein